MKNSPDVSGLSHCVFLCVFESLLYPLPCSLSNKNLTNAGSSSLINSFYAVAKYFTSRFTPRYLERKAITKVLK